VDILGQVLMPEFVTEAAIKEDQQFLTGTGADEPQGILQNDTTGGPWNTDTVTVNSGVAADISFDAAVKAPWRLQAQYRAKRTPTTAFAFNASTGLNLSTLKDSTGAYLWTEMHGDNAQGNPDTLRGWQYAESEAMPNAAANTFPIIFGDFSGYRIVDRVGMSVERYSDASTAETDSVVFFCRRRYGGQVAEGYKFVVIKCAT
jgi:HK97 family phage major capsid protein